MHKDLIFNTICFFTLSECFLAVPDFLHIFAAYFYRGELAELLFCHIVNVVDKGLRVVTMEDKFEADRQYYIVDRVDKGYQWFTSLSIWIAGK